jgi:hypothetical protein
LVSQGQLDDKDKLFRWVGKQRDALKNGRLTAERKELLDDIGFCWDKQEYDWERNFMLLEQFAKREGHCDVPKGHIEDGENLGKWLSNQRGAYKKGDLDESRQLRLEELGVNWKPFEHQWERNVKLLEQYAKREGHCDVPFKHIEEGVNLGKWLSEQRGAYKKGELDKTRQKRLEELGVIWNLQELRNNTSWMHKFNLLVKFKEREGHCRVPQKHIEDGENLGYWLSDQKKAHRKGKLDPERYGKLKELGVEW